VKEFDLVVRCGSLVTMAGGKYEVLKDQFLGVKGSAIAEIGSWKTDGWKSQKTIDAREQIVLPGLINAHSHLPMTLFRGLGDDLPFHDWLNSYILPLEAKLVAPDFVKVGTELACAESILCGVTTVFDMYYYEDVIAEVVDRFGLRGVLGETVFDYTAPDNKARDGGEYRILDKLVERYGQHERIRPMIAPHAPYSCSDGTLKAAAAYAKKRDILLGIHVSETKGEVEGSLKEHGKTPTQRLYDLGVMEARSSFAHCVHLSDSDIALMAKSGTSAVYNPESNMKLGSGAAPIRRLLEGGVVVALGTDGAASNNDLNLFKEMDTGAKLQKLSEARNDAVTAAQLLRMSTFDGARALGLGDVTGSLEEGKRADFIVVDPRVPHMQPLYDVAAQLVYASTGQEVRVTVCHGKILMEDRRITGLDMTGLLKRVEDMRGRIARELKSS
jgi:5-methylthioadenosine/S-adenosylhomocysteine deaminase